MADITEMLTNATQERALSKDDVAYVMTVAKEARRSVRTGEQTPEQAQATLEQVLESHLERMARKNGHDEETGDPVLAPKHERTLQLAMRVMSENAPTLLSESLKD